MQAPLWTRTPVAEQLSQIGFVHVSIIVEIGRAKRASAPAAQKLRQVGRTDRAVAIEIHRVGIELVAANVHNRRVTARIRSLRAIIGIRIINETRGAIEVERDQLVSCLFPFFSSIPIFIP